MSTKVNKNQRTRKQSESEVVRKRGRPTGKNRVPLTLDERRARNAEYERERRNEYAAAMADLADAIGCEQSIPNADLLATVLSLLEVNNKKAKDNNQTSNIDLRRQNELLMSQIETLEKRINGRGGPS